MSQVKTIFGPYADKLQVIIDRSLDKFAPLWYPKYFTFAPQQSTLTFTSAIGRSRIEAAATVVARDSKAPVRSRQALEKLTGDIPAIKESFKMKESDYRDFLTMQALSTNDAQKAQQLIQLLFNDTKNAGDSAHKRLDMMCLEAVSTGKVSLDLTNNPDGLVLDNPIDLLMPAGNRVDSDVSWDSPTTSDPFADIQKIVDAANTRGINFAKMLMTRSAFMYLIRSSKVVTLLSNYLGFKQAGNLIPTLDNVNAFLTAQLWPMIEIVESSVGVEKDGVISTIKPFNANSVSFIPDGNLGTIKNAVSIEQLRPVTNVTYGNYNGALISKWQENNPFAEWTAVELNAFPALEAIDAIYILTAIHA